MTKTEDSLKNLAGEILKELLAKWPLGFTPQLVWRNLRVTAGSADMRARCISLSRLLLTDADRLSTTLVHEYAHMLAIMRSGPSAAGHGEAWKKAMRDLGMDPKRTHDYPVCRNQAHQEVSYRCVRCGHLIVRKRRLPSKRRYVHAGCGGALRFEGARPREPKAEVDRTQLIAN